MVRQRQKGVSFIEALVALVILAVGLLGVLSMQARGLNSNQRAMFSTEVTLLAYDMADRIFSYSTSGANAGEYGSITIEPSTADCTGSLCTIAQIDQNEWIDSFELSSLPGWRGDVSWAQATSTYTISIRWDDERRGDLVAGTVADDCDNNNPQQTLSCFQLEVGLQ